MNIREVTELKEYADTVGVKSYIIEMKPDHSGRYALTVADGCKREQVINADRARGLIDRRTEMEDGKRRSGHQEYRGT